MGTLFLVPTPIGNLEDITLRALRVLREVDLIAAEDTRVAWKLLTRYSISTPVTSYHDRNERDKTPFLLQRLEEEDVALTSDAGTPAISDPGYRLVRGAAARGIPVVALPGASAVTTALAVSGLPGDQFLYLGFLPRRPGPRRRLLVELLGQERTLLAFEAPHRLRESLRDLLETLGDREVALCREMTKLYEEVFRGTLSEALERFQEPRGEFTLVVAGAPEAAASDEEIRAEVTAVRAQGLSNAQAVREVARRLRTPRGRVYALSLERERET